MRDLVITLLRRHAAEFAPVMDGRRSDRGGVEGRWVTRSRPALALALLALAGAAAGCGRSERSAGLAATTATEAAGTAPPAATVTSDPSATTTAPAAPPPEPTGTAPAHNPGGGSPGETQPGGGGDEEPIRQPARFTVSAAGVQPASIAVAPFLPVALTVVNRTGAAVAARLVGTDVTLVAAAGGEAERRLPGQRTGMYTLSLDGGRLAAALVVGDAAGP